MKSVSKMISHLSLLALLSSPLSFVASAADATPTTDGVACQCNKDGSCGEGKCENCKDCKDCVCGKVTEGKKEGQSCKSGKCGGCKKCHKKSENKK